MNNISIVKLSKLIEDYVHDFRDMTMDRLELKKMLCDFVKDLEELEDLEVD